MPPIHMPLRFDAAILSRMRSPVTSRSNCAKESRIFRVSRPMEVVVLNCWVTDTNETPRASKASTILAKSARLPETFDIKIQGWDTANKSTELSDYSVCTTWGRANRHVYLLHVFRQRLNYPDLRRKVKELATLFGVDSILIEDKASGTQLIQDLQAEHLFGTCPYETPSGMDKIMRLHAQTAWFENGLVFLPRHAPWLSDYVTEPTGFPGTKYDDQVDSTTQALSHLNVPSGLEVWLRLCG